MANPDLIDGEPLGLRFVHVSAAASYAHVCISFVMELWPNTMCFCADA